jgi:predicted acyltransferase
MAALVGLLPHLRNERARGIHSHRHDRRLLGIIHVHGQPLEAFIYESAFAPLASPINASLLYAIVNVLFYFFLVWIMYRRGWFLRV